MSRSAWRSLPPSCSDLKALIARLAHPDPARRPTLEEARRSPAFAQLEREAGERQRELWVLMAGREDMLEACAAQVRGAGWGEGLSGWGLRVQQH
jgi:hypothetical protein